METKIKSNFLKIVIPAYRMRSQLFNNVLANINETDAKHRVNGRTNHILWMAGNLVNCRYWLGEALGLPYKDPHADLFSDAKALDENLNYPNLTALIGEWHKISPKLFDRLCNIIDDELLQPYSIGMETPFIEENYLNAIGMCLDREEYLFGQLGLMRRVLGYEAMKYDLDPSIKY